jgi:hypothetical protein
MPGMVGDLAIIFASGPIKLPFSEASAEIDFNIKIIPLCEIFSCRQ